MFYRSLFVLLYFFFWPMCCLFFFDIGILITSLWYLQTLLTSEHSSAISYRTILTFDGHMTQTCLAHSFRYAPRTMPKYNTSTKITILKHTNIKFTNEEWKWQTISHGQGISWGCPNIIGIHLLMQSVSITNTISSSNQAGCEHDTTAY